jgi:hypothetical protein
MLAAVENPFGFVPLTIHGCANYRIPVVVATWTSRSLVPEAPRARMARCDGGSLRDRARAHMQ